MNGWAAQWFSLHGLDWGALAQLLAHYAVLSLLSVGGAITTAPEMHRFLVDRQGWIGDTEFTTSIAIAQAAPGPNILFVALMGWHVAGLAGLAATMAGITLPSSLVALAVGRWGQRRADAVAVRAFTAGFTPLTLGLLLSTGWLLTAPSRAHPGAVALVLATVVAMVKTRIGPLWLIAGGAVVGALGLV
jgi:chromate transporter